MNHRELLRNTDTPMNFEALRWIILAASLLVSFSSGLCAEEPNPTSLEQSFQPQIRPLVARYCHDCHGPEVAEADLDLSSFANWAAVRTQPEVWQKVGEMLDSGQMPPVDAPQPSEAERIRLQQWVREYLTFEAQAHAGDPGRVVLRRLSNAEYTYTLRDLTGVESLDPAREFPVDGAAGEGFTNTGAALVMSPALVTKYLDAAKDVAAHAVLLPDGFHFSPYTTRRDWTNEKLAEIREFYRQFTDSGGGERVNLQGVVFETNEGGRLPLERYFAATLAERESLAGGELSVEAAAAKHGLNAKYLSLLWSGLTDPAPSLLLDGIRTRWRDAKPEDAAALAADVAAWQEGLWRFTTVGHIGKVGGPQRWMEPVSPLAAHQEVRFKIPAAAEGEAVALSLIATDAGDGNEHDYLVWRSPRLVAPGRPDILLRDVRPMVEVLSARREGMFAGTTKLLAAAEDAAAAQGRAETARLAEKHRVDEADLRAWLDYLGIGAGGQVDVTGYFTTQLASAAGYDFIQGWGSHNTPLLLANSSDQHVRIPGNMKPHSVAVHPSPALSAAVGWKSPIAGTIRIEGAVTHAHPECGNGVTWSLELRRGAVRRRLASGRAQGNQQAAVGPLENIAVQQGDLISLLIGPRDGNHACDLTALDWKLIAAGDDGRAWDLCGDVAGNVLAGNPHSDRFGNDGVWHFYAEGVGSDAGPVIPADSLLTKWLAAKDSQGKRKLAGELQTLLTSGPPETKGSPDAALYRQLASLSGPLLASTGGGWRRSLSNAPASPSAPETTWGLDPALFGKHPGGEPLAAADLCVRAPSVLEVRLPSDLAEGCELVTTAVLEPASGAEGSVQAAVVSGRAAQASGLLPSQAKVTNQGGQWTANNRKVSFAAPILVNEGSAARKRVEAAFDEFRSLFPAALCYTKIVPVDEVVTLTLHYREDGHLARLMLDESQRRQLDRLWDELHYISHDAPALVDALEQLIEYATQDADPRVFEPLREPFQERAAAFQQRLVESESVHVEALIQFAPKAWRRPLAAEEPGDLRAFYDSLRKQEIPHDDAFRLTLARVLVSPAFLYKIETPGAGAGQAPVSDWELASRLSYFLWSSHPDEELRQAAAAGELRNPDVFLAQTRRMLRDAKTRRLATEFACQWLHIYNFDQLDEKSERHFPTFAGLRGAMYEESIQFFTHLFQKGGSVLQILDADYAFLNEELARHYGVPGVSGPEWRRVEGVRRHARGGILAQATTLATQSGASRTSPVLRGNWISEVLLGERLPRPPKDVPQIADDETATEGLTVRQLVERHASDARCAICHRRIDPLGFSLEQFDAIGRRREKDLGDRPIDTRVQTIDGAEFEGLEGLRDYLLTSRRDAFLKQFCRKLLGYALGRPVQLSDQPLLAEMQRELKTRDYQFAAAVETIVRSRQFREIRGREAAYEE
jgi:hypothetical protein